MAEASDNAAIFIATSFQAMERAKFRIPPDSVTVNLMIALVFLGFYLEENLDVIIARVNRDEELREFFMDKKGKKKLGLLNKFGWFYNSYILRAAQHRLQRTLAPLLPRSQSVRLHVS